MVMANNPAFTMTITETITHVSVWDTVGPTGGNFLFSVQLATPRYVTVGDTLNISALTVSFGPITT
jgi:predicted small integral membrane protein